MSEQPTLHPCPCEEDVPDRAPSAVAGAEWVIRHVPVSQWLLPNGRLSAAAFPRDELRGIKGKSVSVLRGMTPPDEVTRRGAALNKEPAWASDPLIARAPVSALRQIVDREQRREICVNADPVETPLGFCPTHASVLRAFPPLDPRQLMEWATLREELADAFAEIAHASGQPVAPPSF